MVERLRAMSGVELIELAISKHPEFKDVALELERREVDSLATQTLVEAYRTERTSKTLR